jgi:hypothetical protein
MHFDVIFVAPETDEERWRVECALDQLASWMREEWRKMVAERAIVSTETEGMPA